MLKCFFCQGIFALSVLSLTEVLRVLYEKETLFNAADHNVIIKMLLGNIALVCSVFKYNSWNSASLFWSTVIYQIHSYAV